MMLLSSSGPGHQILSLRIAGSNPASSTETATYHGCSFFYYVVSTPFSQRGRIVRQKKNKNTPPQ